MTTPLVTIITPLFNKEKYIEETIFSVKSQTYEHVEHLVIDDGSDDDSYVIAQSLSNSHDWLRVWRRNAQRSGAQACRNEGIMHANGDYIIFLDADDVLGETCIQNRVEYMQKHVDLDFAVFQQYIFHDSPGDSDIVVNVTCDKKYDLIRFYKFIVNVDVPWVNSAPIWRMESILKNKIYWDEEYLCYQDVLFHISAIVKGLAYSIVESAPDCYWRRQVDGNIGSNLKKPNYIISTINLIHELKRYAYGLSEEKILNTVLDRNMLYLCVYYNYLIIPDNRKDLKFYDNKSKNIYAFLGKIISASFRYIKHQGILARFLKFMLLNIIKVYCSLSKLGDTCTGRLLKYKYVVKV